MSRNQQIFDVAETLTQPPDGDNKAQMWIAGVVFATVPLIYGIVCCATSHAKTINMTLRGFRPIGRGLFLDIYGSSAISFGVFFICLACFMHFQWFWGNHPKLVYYFEIGKYLSVVGIIGALAAHAYFMLS